jgi:3-methyladenine DNA glycosylase/8-oxoguanine DNA glycosylase
MNIETPSDFNFQSTISGHGWSELLPFETDANALTLSRVFGSDKPVSATLSATSDGLNIESRDAAALEKPVRHILRLDENFADFYELLKTEKRLAWIAENNAGRLLRSPTVFEDLVKSICTTNCSWAMTKLMTTNLVNKLGTRTADGKRSFPTAEAMANQPLEFYKDEMRAGYRAVYFKELAENVATGRLNPELWLANDAPTKDLKREMKQVLGVGDYAAENLLKLVGRYDGLALDSWLRGRFYKKHNRNVKCDDRQIVKFYDKFGKWRGLVIWLDMTEKGL